ncbi:hypothetical protein COO60DRAFT_1234878 [Scenedesmus sp. NREL 46B-D3]|nr:hypothetical protein COO60DRAFT_1234878 [Scenedesmus sp. NREL 46B-D3]
MATSSSSSSSSSNSSSSSSTLLSAARQLSSLWKSRQHAKLLKQPPPAAFSGTAKEAVLDTTPAEAARGRAGLDACCRSLAGNTAEPVWSLCASAAAGRSDGLAATAPRASHWVPGARGSHAALWSACMHRIYAFRLLVKNCSSHSALLVEQWTCALDGAGLLDS